MNHFYLLQTWGYGENISIERGIEEYGNPDITHNVEYSLHPIIDRLDLRLEGISLPITAKKFFKTLVSDTPSLNGFKATSSTLLTKERVLRNSCTVAIDGSVVYLAFLKKINEGNYDLDIVGQYRRPYAIFECKRVGIEEGCKKGPQTIEKAKQGAYVARAVSALQKVRSSSGELLGVIPKGKGLYHKNYIALIEEIIKSDLEELLKAFVLTVGVVSNHGNWFTSEDHNKELKVLAQSYDWLLFLTDEGLSNFIDEVIVKPNSTLKSAKEAFTKSYSHVKKKKEKNQFTKVQMHIDADKALREYFLKNLERVETWFNIITPGGKKLSILQNELNMLGGKNWKRIHGL